MHSFILSNHFILVRWLPDGKPVHRRASFTHSFTPRGHQIWPTPARVFLDSRRKPENIKETHTNTRTCKILQRVSQAQDRTLNPTAVRWQGYPRHHCSASYRRVLRDKSAIYGLKCNVLFLFFTAKARMLSPETVQVLLKDTNDVKVRLLYTNTSHALTLNTHEHNTKIL